MSSFTIAEMEGIGTVDIGFSQSTVWVGREELGGEGYRRVLAALGGNRECIR